MLKTKEFRTAIAVIACALGTGYVMQNSPFETREGTSVPAGGAVLEMEEITLTSAEFDHTTELPGADAVLTNVSAPQTLSSPRLPEPVLAACDITAEARPGEAAMVQLRLSAPCLPNERVTMHHHGMMFTETTSSDGTLDLIVPALARDAVFILAFPNGDGAVAQTRVEEVGDFDRVVLQWKGDTGFHLHAREFGADYDAEGHVWAGAPRDMSAAAEGTGGFLTRHGDPAASDALRAEVYTFPARAASRAGNVDLTVETMVDRANCGLEIEAQSLEMTAGGAIRSRDLTLAVPECDAAGSFLVLNNLVQDLKVARN